MSLVMAALRISVVRALRAALPPPFVVYDSPQEPIDELWKQGMFPFVTIFTGHTSIKYDGRLSGEDAAVSFELQFILPEKVSFDVDVGSGGSITIDTRLQGAEIVLDGIWSDVEHALKSSSEPWAALWREFVMTTPQIMIDSYMLMNEGVRVAPGRQIIITCSPIHGPIPGGAPAGAWATLLTLMRADTGADGLSALADWFESKIRGGPDLPQFKRDRAYMGISGYVGDAIGVTDLVQDVDNLNVTPADEYPADPANPDAQI